MGRGLAPLPLLPHLSRQPWQDIHSRLHGPVALDVLRNFVERWSKQAVGSQGRLLQLSPQDFVLEEEVGDWNVQLLRSITDDSATFADMMRLYTLTVKKSRRIEDSIARAYIHAIRSAERFIYIENQYFLGSAYAWATDAKTNCHHTVPAEIAEKVAEKVMAGEEFTAYIVLPLHPEGDPGTAAIQEILAWQRRTMAMMYRRVGAALQLAGSQAHPQDLLLFLCPVAREAVSVLPDYLEEPQPGTKAAQLRTTRRFMIYVHSKLMIVDDSVAILGSANINQRSLAGSRDTEVAVSVEQPGSRVVDGVLPRGEVAAFRWAGNTSGV